MAQVHYTKGFTIVELLIVIVVIAILATISAVAYYGIQARAHDARRIADIDSIENSYEMYRITQGAYPGTYSVATSPDVITQGLAAQMIEMTGTAQNPCPTTPKTKICVYAYATKDYSEYALVYWDYGKEHWINQAVGIGQADSADRWRVQTNYGVGDHPIKP